MNFKIYWHEIILREFEDRERAENAWEFFNKFLLKDKLRFEEI